MQGNIPKFKVDRQRMLEDKLITAVAKKLGITDWHKAPEALRLYLHKEIHHMLLTGRMTNQDLGSLANNARKLHHDFLVKQETPNSSPDATPYTPHPPEITPVNPPKRSSMDQTAALAAPSSASLPGFSPALARANTAKSAAPKFVKPLNEKVKTMEARQRADLDQQMMEREDARKKAQMDARIYAEHVTEDVNKFETELQQKKEKKRLEVATYRDEQASHLRHLDDMRRQKLDDKKKEDLRELQELQKKEQERIALDAEKKLKTKDIIQSQRQETLASLEVKKKLQLEQKDADRRTLNEAVKLEEKLEKTKQAMKHKGGTKIAIIQKKQNVIFEQMLQKRSEKEKEEREHEALFASKMAQADREKDLAQQKREEARRLKKEEFSHGLGAQIAAKDEERSKEQKENRKVREIVEAMALQEALDEETKKQGRRERGIQLTTALQAQIQHNVVKPKVLVKLSDRS